MAQAVNETVRLFGELARVVLDPAVRDAQLRRTNYQHIPPERLRKAVEESSGIVRPGDDSGLDFFRKQYGHLRQFIPAFLAAFSFRSSVDPDPLLKAVELLRRLSQRRGPSLPLSILEHTTDTAGYTEIVFALFALLGFQFSPQIRDLGDQRLYRFDRSRTYPNLEPRLKGRIRRDLILRHWDDLLRVAGSLKGIVPKFRSAS
jgi:hypothetical protein